MNKQNEKLIDADMQEDFKFKYTELMTAPSEKIDRAKFY